MIKGSYGGVLIYVLVLWGVLLFFLGLILALFSSSVVSVKQSKSYLQSDFLLKNVFENTVERYKENPLDEKIYAQAAGVSHQITRYKNDQVIRLTNQNTQDLSYVWEFSQNQKELSFIDSSTEAPYPNNLNEIKNFIIVWDMKTDDSYSFVKQYNPQQQNQNTDLRIDVIKVGGTLVHRCFLTSNPAITITDPGVSSAFTKQVLFDEAFFYDPALASDCSQKDPLDENTILNSNGVLALDFENVSYLLKIEVIDGQTLVQVQGDGNNSYIPTENVYFDAYLEDGGGALSQQVFIGGKDSLVFSLLSDAERVYKTVSYTDPLAISSDARMYFLRNIFEKY